MRMWSATILAVAALLGAAPAATGFTVVKNVNSGRPPKVTAVLFDKARGHENVVLEDLVDGSTMGFAADGAVEIQTAGSKGLQPTIFWKAADGGRATFDATASAYLIVTFKIEGEVRRTFPNGRVTSRRPKNLWLAIRLLDADGKVCGRENIATLTDDRSTPAEMTAVRIPLILLTGGSAADASRAAGVGFYWPGTHKYNDRRFRLVVDRIVLAD